MTLPMGVHTGSNLRQRASTCHPSPSARVPVITTPSPKLILATLACVAVYLGLAILGWGGFAAFFAHPARTALIVVMLALTVAALFSGGTSARACARIAETAGCSLASPCSGSPALTFPPDRTGSASSSSTAMSCAGSASRSPLWRLAPPLAGLRARRTVQRLSGDPAGAHARHERHLRRIRHRAISGFWSARSVWR